LRNLWAIGQDRTRPLQQEETTRLRYYEGAYFENLNNFRKEPLEQQFFKWEIGYPEAINIVVIWDQKLESQEDEVCINPGKWRTS
jgi:hypothetical protein